MILKTVSKLLQLIFVFFLFFFVSIDYVSAAISVPTFTGAEDIGASFAYVGTTTQSGVSAVIVQAVENVTGCTGTRRFQGMNWNGSAFSYTSQVGGTASCGAGDTFFTAGTQYILRTPSSFTEAYHCYLVNNLGSLNQTNAEKYFCVYQNNGTYDLIGDVKQLTRIKTVFPANDTVVSTSTPVTVGWTHFVDDADYVDGIRIIFRAYNVNAFQSVSVGNMAEAQYQGECDSVSDYLNCIGAIVTGTTTPMFATSTVLTSSGSGGGSYTWDMSAFPPGRYTVQATMYFPEENPEGIIENITYYFKKSWNNIMNHLESIDGIPNEDTVAGNSTLSSTFVLDELSYYDTQYDVVTNTKQSFRNCDLSLSVFSWFSSDSTLLDCLVVLIIPTDQQFASLWQSMTDSVLSVFPLGYITRTVTIFTTTQASAPPDIMYTYGYSAPVSLQGKGFEVDLWSQFYLLNSEITSDTIGNQKTIWEIVEPYFQMMVALAVWSMILYDILELGLPNFGGVFNSRGEELAEEYTTSGNVRVKQMVPRHSHNIPIRKNLHDVTIRRNESARNTLVIRRRK